MSRKNRINYIVTGALIATIYAGLTYLSNIFGLAYGPIQLRVSEVLTILPIFTPAAISGLTVGCFIANIGSFNMLDMIFGSFATLSAALITYFLRNIKFKKLPILSMLSPVIINALIIGLEITWFFMPEASFLYGFLISAFEVGISELVVCVGFGIPFYLIVKKYRIFERKFTKVV